MIMNNLGRDLSKDVTTLLVSPGRQKASNDGRMRATMDEISSLCQDAPATNENKAKGC